ncbi:hypothetical protein FRC00_013011, partial [Tulasnella sp. 408]
TKSKWWLLGFLSLLPIAILAFFVVRYTRRPETIDSAAELPLPVVAIRRSRAPDTTATSLLRAWRSIPTPSVQGLRTISSRYTTVFDRTNAFNYLVDARLSISPETRTSIVTILNDLRESQAVVTNLQRLARPLEPGPVSDQRRAQVERLAIDQPEDHVGVTSVSSACGNYPQAGTLSNETLPTSRATSPASATPITSPTDTKGSAALQSTLPSIVLTPSDQTTSEVIFGGTSGYVDDKAKGLEPDRNPSDTGRSIVSLASSVSGRVPHTSFVGISSCALDVISVPFKRSRKVALKGPNTFHHAEWRRKPLDDVATAVARGRATNTPPQLTDTPISTPALSSDDGKLCSTTASWPTPTPSTPPTSIDLQPDNQRGADTPSSTLESALQSPNEAQVLDTEATVREAPDGLVQATVAWWRQDVPSKDVQSSRRSRHRRRRFGHDALKSPADEDWKWAKTEGKKPVGGRRPLVVTKPASPTTLVASDAVDDERGEGGFEDEELQKAILMSMGLVFEDGEAAAEASLTCKQFDGQLLGVPLEPPPPYSPSESHVYVDKGGFPVSDLEKALQESMSVVQTTVPTMDEEDDLDKDGFSKSQQQQAREASRDALVMPFYGATTSCAVQPLSEEEWGLLEEFEATSSN